MNLPEQTTIGSGIFDGDNWVLVTDSQDVVSVLESVGSHAVRHARAEALTGLYVLVGNAEYDAVYGFHGCIPWIYRTAYRIYPSVFQVGDVVRIMGHGTKRYRVKHVNQGSTVVVVRPVGMRNDPSQDRAVGACQCIRTR
jgi:hypothetical protein